MKPPLETAPPVLQEKNLQALIATLALLDSSHPDWVHAKTAQDALSVMPPTATVPVASLASA